MNHLWNLLAKPFSLKVNGFMILIALAIIVVLVAAEKRLNDSANEQIADLTSRLEATKVLNNLQALRLEKKDEVIQNHERTRLVTHAIANHFANKTDLPGFIVCFDNEEGYSIIEDPDQWCPKTWSTTIILEDGYLPGTIEDPSPPEKIGVADPDFPGLE
ncbi:MAG: hypothetical protein V1664_03460 [Candidatus Uhrbacteria bacterium]